MMKDHWPEAALTNGALVAELLLRLKHSSDSSHASPLPTTATPDSTLLLPPVWGHRKNRSKAPFTTTAAAAPAAANGFRKEQRGSPTTHLSWSGGGCSTSDYDESSRPSDLSSGGRSVKANEGASTSIYNKSKKRKSFIELKEEEGFLLKERAHLNKELVSMRVTLHQQMTTSENLKRIKISLDQKPKNEMATTLDHERGFVLPDLNMTPSEED